MVYDQFFAHMEEIDFCWRLKNEYVNNKIIGIEKQSIPYWSRYLELQSPNKYYLNLEFTIDVN